MEVKENFEKWGEKSILEIWKGYSKAKWSKAADFSGDHLTKHSRKREGWKGEESGLF